MKIPVDQRCKYGRFLRELVDRCAPDFEVQTLLHVARSADLYRERQELFQREFPAGTPLIDTVALAYRNHQTETRRLIAEWAYGVRFEITSRGMDLTIVPISDGAHYREYEVAWGTAAALTRVVALPEVRHAVMFPPEDCESVVQPGTDKRSTCGL